MKTERPYKDQYLVYNRKSTDDAENQKNSISYQTIEAIKYARQKGLPIAKVNIQNFCTDGIINERHSGFKEDADFSISEDGLVSYRIERPKFEKLAKLLLNREFKGVIFLCWDRASRNKNDNNILRRLMKTEDLDIRFVQATYEKTSSGELHMDIDSMVSEHHSRNTSEKVRNTNRKLRNEGYCTYRAPIGYLNQGDPRSKLFDPVRAPLVKQLFQKYAEGTWSLADLARWSNENGLTARPVRRKRTIEERLADEEVKIEPIERSLTFNHIHKILTNSFYIGKVLGNDGVYIQGKSHQPLVEEELFYAVQSSLNIKKASTHYKNKLYFPYRGLIRCGSCGRVYSPYDQKGTAYYGARCAKGCDNSNRSINSNNIENKIGEIMAGLSFTQEELDEIDSKVRGEVSILEDERRIEIKALEQQKKKLREDQTYLRKNKLTLLKTGAYTPEDYLKQESEIAQKLQILRNKEEVSDISMEKVVQDVVLLSELLQDAYLYYLLANPTEKQQIITKIFSELTLFGETLNYKCRNGFRVLENRKTLLCDPTGNRTPITGLKSPCPNH
jgi:site-specific DNA recombinase